MLKKIALTPGLVGVVLLVGCGPSRSTVVGSVTYKGNKVPHGTVTFMGKDGVPVSASITDGAYEAKDVIFGDVIVTVEQQAKDAKSPSEWRKAAAAGEQIPQDAFTRPQSLLPEKYRRADSSDLKLTVSQKRTTYDIELKADE